MTVFYGTQMTKIDSVAGTPLPATVGGSVRCFAETVTMAAQTTSDTIEVAKLPKGAIVLGGWVNNSASLGSSTIAIGISGTTGKYHVAATKTTTTQIPFNTPSTTNAPLAADETVFITIGAATLPATGSIWVTFLYAVV